MAIRAIRTCIGLAHHCMPICAPFRFPAPGWGRVWRAADIVREYRGDSPITAWVAAGLDPVEAV